MSQEKIIKKYIAEKFKTEIHANTILYNVSISEIAGICKELFFEYKLQIKTITAVDERGEKKGFKIFYVFGIPNENVFLVPYINLKDKEEFPSIAIDVHEASKYERKIKSFFWIKSSRSSKSTADFAS